MLTLTQASKEAFANREITLEPILTVTDEGGTQYYISPSLLLSRPSRQLSPLITRSPVMRLDLEIAPTEEMLLLFVEGRRVAYTEVINGQPVERFKGRVHALDKGWVLKDGAVDLGLKVTCTSDSQQLGDMDAELFYTATTIDVGAGNGLVAQAVVTRTTTFAQKASAGNDALPVNAVWRPHQTGDAATISWLAAGVPVTRTGGTDFKLVVNGTSGLLEVQWLANAPASGTNYRLDYKAPLGFVFAYPAAPFPTATATAAVLGSYLVDLDMESSIEAIDDANLPRFRYFAPSASRPVLYQRVNAASAVPAAGTITDWEFRLERGWFRYLGKGAIFDTEQKYGGEVMFLGVAGLAWPSESLDNSAERLFARLYEQAGVIPDAATYGNFRATGITVAEANFRGKGIQVLSSLYASVPPNYVLLDGDDGPPRGKFLVQRDTPDFVLSTVTGLKDKEPPERATRVVVRGSVPGVPARPDVLVQGFSQAADGYYGALLDNDAAYATIAGGQSYLQIAYLFTSWNRPAAASVRFEGELRVYVADPDRMGRIDPTTLRFIPGMAQIYKAAKGDQALDAARLKDAFSAERLEGRFLVLQLWPTAAVPAPKLYLVTITEDLYQDSYAVLTNVDAPSDGTWMPFRASLQDGSTPEVGYLRNVGTDLLWRWMVRPLDGSEPGFTGAWNAHRNKVVEIDGVSRKAGNRLATAYMDDILRRATAQEVDVVLEPAAQIGDTVLVRDLATGEEYLRLVVGFRDGSSWEEPSTTLELANFT